MELHKAANIFIPEKQMQTSRPRPRTIGDVIRNATPQPTVPMIANFENNTLPLNSDQYIPQELLNLQAQMQAHSFVPDPSAAWPSAAWSGGLTAWPVENLGLREFQGIYPPSEIMGQPKVAAEGWWSKTKKWVSENKDAILVGTSAAAVMGAVAYANYYGMGIGDELRRIYNARKFTSIGNKETLDKTTLDNLKDETKIKSDKYIKDYDLYSKSGWFKSDLFDVREHDETPSQALLDYFIKRKCHKRSDNEFLTISRTQACHDISGVLNERKYLVYDYDAMKSMKSTVEYMNSKKFPFVNKIIERYNELTDLGGVAPETKPDYANIKSML